jgi:tetratricopeptide (TPR) repeat protein
MKHRASLPILGLAAAFCILLFASAAGLLQAEATAPTPREPGSAETFTTTNSQGELTLNAAALEQLRRDIETTAARNTSAITSGLAMLEPALAQLHKSQMQMVQSSNQTILIVAGLFAGVGFIALMSIVALLVRALGRFSEFAGNANRHAMLASPAGSIGPGDIVNVNATAVEQASERFQHAIEHLQKRILELESAATPNVLEAGKPHSPAAAPSAANISQLPPHDAVRRTADSAETASRASLLLGKGQALLNLDQAGESLECFDEILALDPNHTEALIRRGLALEKLESWEKALESYDRALAIDSSLTVAYLYKGGVCNKLQRHREALDSYEHALHSEKRSRAS